MNFHTDRKPPVIKILLGHKCQIIQNPTAALHIHRYCVCYDITGQLLCSDKNVRTILVT